jgi:polyribonucleotide nucleotidyltransferase
MLSSFEYYFPPIFFSKELSDEDNKRYELFIECMASYYSESSEDDNKSIISNESVEMMIENKDIGKIIGNRGSIITKIRLESGANIKIFDDKFGTKRKINICGSEFNVLLAKQKIIECLKK